MRVCLMMMALLALGAFLGGCNRMPPLQAAIFSGDQRKVERLLAEGVDVDDRGDEWGYPLHMAAERGNKAIVELLLSKGASLHREDRRSGLAALHFAVCAGHRDVVLVLIAHGADVNQRSADTEQLVEEGNDPNNEPGVWGGGSRHIEVARGKMPLDLAVVYGHPDVAELLRQHGASGDWGDDLTDTQLMAVRAFSRMKERAQDQVLPYLALTSAPGRTELGLTDQQVHQIEDILAEDSPKTREQHLLDMAARASDPATLEAVRAMSPEDRVRKRDEGIATWKRLQEQRQQRIMAVLTPEQRPVAQRLIDAKRSEIKERRKRDMYSRRWISPPKAASGRDEGPSERGAVSCRRALLPRGGDAMDYGDIDLIPLPAGLS